MERNEFVLASMALAGDESLSPVQVQKFFFLLDRNLDSSVGGPYFDFQPYDYGPFDKEVYNELESLSEQDFMRVTEGGWGRPRLYTLTPKGVKASEQIKESLSPAVKQYISELGEWLSSLSFEQLISFIYNQYPEMKENSVFRERA